MTMPTVSKADTAQHAEPHLLHLSQVQEMQQQPQRDPQPQQAKAPRRWAWPWSDSALVTTKSETPEARAWLTGGN